MEIPSFLKSLFTKAKNKELFTSTVRDIKKKAREKKNRNYTTERFHPNINAGLNDEQIAIRTQHNEINDVKSTSEKSYLQIIFNNVVTFYNIFMSAIAVILVLVVGPSVILNLAFLIILIFNVLIGTIQECKSKKSLDRLKLLNKGYFTVIRNSKEIQILQNQILLDDIIIFKNGDQIPVDCIILTDNPVEVNESLLTGESVPVVKSKGHILLAGSYIVSGKCTCIADKIGEDTYLYSIESKAKQLKQTKSKLMIDTNRIIKTLAFIAIPLSLIVLINELLSGSAITSAVLYWGTTITYMIPAGLLLITSISMATGVVKLATKKTLAQDLYSVEALSRINTLCLDKTGTITDGTMCVDSVHIVDIDVNLDLIMSSYLQSMQSENQTSIALSKKYNDENILKAIDTIEFKSENKFSMVKFENGDIYALGATEYLTNKEDLLKLATNSANKGLRVLALVKVKGKFDVESAKSKANHEVALFMIRDNIRPEIKKTLEWFDENDVDVKVISGDNIGTVSYIAKEAGIRHWDKCVDMSTINEDDIEYIVMTNSIFGRVTPEQKVQIVEILQKNGRKVAMTGDGINDIGALKKADCSIALANGAPSTKNISNLVLLDSNFNNMKEAVMEGRRVVNNIQRSSSLFVMKDFFWLFITLFPILIGMTHQLEPTIMTIVNLILTGCCSFILALEPDKSRIRGNFLKTVLGKAISAGFFMFLPVLLIYIYAFFRVGLDRQAVSEFIAYMVPVISISVTISGLMIFYKLCQPFTKFRKRLFFTALCVIILLLTAIPEFFLINGTSYLSQLIAENDSVFGIMNTIWKSLFSFEVYKTFSLEQWLIIGGFLLLCMISYNFWDKLVMKVLNITMFNKMEDED